jgi:acyl phosphate:glycerol-3-phosphate acyltransferase
MDLRGQLLLAPRPTAKNENTILKNLRPSTRRMEIVVIIFSYLLGSIPTGYIVGVLAGVDIRKVGSGNVGATNVARAVGKKRGVLTLIADVVKGFVPVFIAGRLDLSHTALGVLLALAPMATLILIAVFAVVAVSSRLVSLSSIITALAAPFTLWSFSYSPTVIATGVFLAVMITVRHRDNIRRLLAGTEPRFGSRVSSR